MNGESRLSAASSSAAGHVTTFVDPPATIGDALSDVFDTAAAAYLVAVDAEEWAAVWGLLDIIDKIHNLAERTAGR